MRGKRGYLAATFRELKDRTGFVIFFDFISLMAFFIAYKQYIISCMVFYAL
jgi:hypothetical protein